MQNRTLGPCLTTIIGNPHFSNAGASASCWLGLCTQCVGASVCLGRNPERQDPGGILRSLSLSRRLRVSASICAAGKRSPGGQHERQLLCSRAGGVGLLEPEVGKKTARLADPVGAQLLLSRDTPGRECLDILFFPVLHGSGPIG
jgi:hypothetical protein